MRFERIGPYHLVKRIARGGMGEVYLARKEGLARNLALKVMLEKYHDFPELRSRFLREMNVLARVEHQNICQILDAGEYEGHPYYVMPYLAGQDLRAVLRTQRISYSRAADIARQVADALDFAHSQDIIHRDLKPENIILVRTNHPAVQPDPSQSSSLLHGLKTRIGRWIARKHRAKSIETCSSERHEETPDPSSGVDSQAHRMMAPTLLTPQTSSSPQQEAAPAPSPLDELHKRAPSPDYRDRVYLMDFGLAADMSDESGLTRTSIAMGTPAYMAPEQILAQRDRIGPWTDVYETGAVLYEMTTLRVPFPQSNFAELGLAIQYDDPAPPRRLRPDLPRDLEAVILKCLEKEPRHRYQAARQLEEDLQRFLAGEPVQARPQGLVYRLYRKAARFKKAVAFSLGFLLLFIGSLAYFLFLGPHLKHRAAVFAEQEALEIELQDKRVREHSAHERMREANDLFEQGQFAECLDLCKEIQKEYSDDLGKRIDLSAFKYCEEALTEQQLADARTPCDVPVAQAACLEAEVHRKMGDTDAMFSSFAQAYQFAIRSGGPDRMLIPEALLETGIALFQMGRYDRASPAFGRITASWPESKDYPRAAYYAARCLEAMERFDEARLWYRRALESGKLQPAEEDSAREAEEIFSHILPRTRHSLVAGQPGVGDVDSDGSSEVLVLDNEGVIHVYDCSTGKVTLRLRQDPFDRVGIAAGTEANAFLVSDVDGDGENETVVDWAGGAGGMVRVDVLEWTGSGFALAEGECTHSQNAVSLFSDDPDGDGSTEIVMTGGAGRDLRILRYDGEALEEVLAVSLGAVVLEAVAVETDGMPPAEILLSLGPHDLRRGFGLVLVQPDLENAKLRVVARLRPNVLSRGIAIDSQEGRPTRRAWFGTTFYKAAHGILLRAKEALTTPRLWMASIEPEGISDPQPVLTLPDESGQVGTPLLVAGRDEGSGIWAIPTKGVKEGFLYFTTSLEPRPDRDWHGVESAAHVWSFSGDLDGDGDDELVVISDEGGSLRMDLYGRAGEGAPPLHRPVEADSPASESAWEERSIEESVIVASEDMMDMGLLPSAKKALIDLIAREDADGEIRVRADLLLVDCLMRLGKYEDAVNALEPLLRGLSSARFPMRRIEALFLRAFALERLRRWGDLEDTLTRLAADRLTMQEKERVDAWLEWVRPRTGITRSFAPLPDATLPFLCENPLALRWDSQRRTLTVTRNASVLHRWGWPVRYAGGPLRILFDLEVERIDTATGFQMDLKRPVALVFTPTDPGRGEGRDLLRWLMHASDQGVRASAYVISDLERADHEGEPRPLQLHPGTPYRIVMDYIPEAEHLWVDIYRPGGQRIADQMVRNISRSIGAGELLVGQYYREWKGAYSADLQGIFRLSNLEIESVSGSIVPLLESPETAWEHFLRAGGDLVFHRYEEAVEGYSVALMKTDEVESEADEEYNRASAMEVEMAAIERAFSSVEKPVLGRRSIYVEAYCFRAFAHLGAGRKEAAEKDLASALSHDPLLTLQLFRRSPYGMTEAQWSFAREGVLRILFDESPALLERLVGDLENVAGGASRYLPRMKQALAEGDLRAQFLPPFAELVVKVLKGTFARFLFADADLPQ